MLIAERNGRKLGTRGPRVYICRILFASDSLSSVWGHSVHFAKFAILRFSKRYCFYSFYPFSTNFMESVVIRGNAGYCVFRRAAIFLKIKYGTLKCFLTHDYMGLEISKRYFSLLFQPNFTGTLPAMGGNRLLLSFVISRFDSIKILWRFEILTWESIEKS